MILGEDGTMTLAIYCAGGLGKETIELARIVNRWEKIVFVDDVTNVKEYQGTSVHRFEDVASFEEPVEFIIANGEPEVRKALYEKIKTAGYSLTVLVSPWASMCPGTTLGEGCILWDCVLSADINVGPNVLINVMVTIGHDTVIGAHSVISAKSFLGGNVHMEERVYMAPCAMAKDRIRIGESAIISLGAVLLRNVRPKAIMVGNPARRIGENETGRVFGMFD